ncbi:MAG: helix-turn-helix domain-containing protein [Cytophagales bacterium]|nr:helix-turn-helix domain-containing protein [Cytophagales bacterium]
MSDFLQVKNEFLEKVVAEIEANLGDEQFGVTELADRMHMSRSSLLRKVQKSTDQSVSVFIRNVRLHHANSYLKDEALTISEIAFKVGFSSNSYFIKCYKERYGHSPGEARKQAEEMALEDHSTSLPNHRNLILVSGSALLLILIVFGWMLSSQKQSIPEKSIAVLPFINDSQDSSNVYIINGMMESILNNLQKIEDLRVVSRTSVEPYRNLQHSIRDIAEDLEVYYVLEGSGQKIGDQLLFTVQLIQGKRDSHLWSKQYQRTTQNIFDLQAEVASDVAAEIEVIITPDEQRRIATTPTKDPVAFDHYLKGVAFTKSQSLEGLDSAIVYFEKATFKDPDFASAHAYLAICYYYLDVFKLDKQYSEIINRHADRAILLDPESGICVISKGLYYLHEGQYERAITYFEKTLEYNPNSAEANNLLSLIYNSYLPDSKKYLKYALRGAKLEKSGSDSTATGFLYLHLANALIQNGFVKEAEQSARTSLRHDPDNLYSEYVLAYILLAQDRNIERTRDMLLATLQRDTTRLDIIQEVAKVYYSMELYDTAYYYYDKFLKTRDLYGMSVFEAEEAKIAFVLKQLGKDQEAQVYLDQFKAYAEEDVSIYQDLHWFSYYAVTGEMEKSIAHLDLFSKQSGFQYWFVLFLEDDPITRSVMNHPGYEVIADRINTKFWESHNKLKEQLKQEGLL